MFRLRDYADATQRTWRAGTSGGQRLLAERDDLRGVHAFADVVEESVRWSA